ncbi:hypothetical protein J7643_14305 [bacterium]|nr:hypothetical protein [bacterium]
MKPSKLFVFAGALLLAIAGCASLPPTSQAPLGPSNSSEAPALTLKLDLGRRVQAVARDVAGARVSLSVAGRVFETQATLSVVPLASPSPGGPTPSPSQAPLENVIELSKATGMALVAGDARVHVEAIDQEGRVIGSGDAVAPLLIGRRSYVQVLVKLDSTGRTEYMPFTPLGPQPSPSPEPTWFPSAEPLPSPTGSPSFEPTPEPTRSPSPEPTP